MESIAEQSPNVDKEGNPAGEGPEEEKIVRYEEPGNYLTEEVVNF